jgi:hypothetical protein
LLKPFVKEDRPVKKWLILGTALGLTLVGLLRIDPVAKAPAGEGRTSAKPALGQAYISAPPRFLAWKPAAIDRAFSHDAKLTDAQRLFRDWSEETWPGLLDKSWWQSLDAPQRAAAEQQWLNDLAGEGILVREKAIRALTAIGSKQAVPAILKNATDREERDNSDRCEACRALGILGDQSVVPELVHLVYHYNWNTRTWAQISLVRLTGQNFGGDLAAWRKWWQSQGGKPPIAGQAVAWAVSPEIIALTRPATLEAYERQWIADRKRELRRRLPHDEKLNAMQRAMRDQSEQAFQQNLDPSPWEDLPPAEKAAEEKRWTKQLSNDSEGARITAIYALTAMRSKQAVPEILAIAADRTEKGNADRCCACRALGIIGDSSVVPELVHLTYHYNRDTRLWAQISLVRLTGQNFGRDVAAWRRWWQQQGGKPAIPVQPVAWATSPDAKQSSDPQTMDESDHLLIAQSRQASWRSYSSVPPTTSPEPAITTSKVGEIQADGSIRCRCTLDMLNPSGKALTSFAFMSSDFDRLEKVTDAGGRPVRFTTEHSDGCYRYQATLNEPVPAGGHLVMKMDSRIRAGSLLKPTGKPGEFRYDLNHCPNAPFPVRQVELHRLPPGAELLTKEPSDLAETRKDGRIELRLERTIPGGGSLRVSYAYRLAPR